MDPATIAAISALLGLIKEYGLASVFVIVSFVLVRSWQRGDVLSRRQHEDITKMHDQRLIDMAQRTKEALDERDNWKVIAERATDAAEASQREHSGLGNVVNEIRVMLGSRPQPAPRRGA